ncbi:MAG: trypsin-like serine peptidase [Caulobacteraceae bacterium]
MASVADTSKFPYNTIGLLSINLENGISGWGSGTLIDHSHILTCGHNIYFRKNKATSAVFYRGHNSDDPPTDGGLLIKCAFLTEYFRQGDRSWDIGLYRLAKPLGGAATMTPTIVNRDSDLPVEPLLTGYPNVHHFNMWEEQELISGANVGDHIFAYTHDSSQGSSGSPLFTVSGGKASVMGVHSGLSYNRHPDKVGVLINMQTFGFNASARETTPKGDGFVTFLQQD